mmetsp:Transcript_46314/g.77001  ORF Transcript_46314/g.77001 Transcript_46314/m.77001 type:complete len:279 (+) Transcript_46314:400-1236(+)
MRPMQTWSHVESTVISGKESRRQKLNHHFCLLNVMVPPKAPVVAITRKSLPPMPTTTTTMTTRIKLRRTRMLKRVVQVASVANDDNNVHHRGVRVYVTTAVLLGILLVNVLFAEAITTLDAITAEKTATWPGIVRKSRMHRWLRNVSDAARPDIGPVIVTRKLQGHHSHRAEGVVAAVVVAALVVAAVAVAERMCAIDVVRKVIGQKIVIYRIKVPANQTINATDVEKLDIGRKIAINHATMDAVTAAMTIISYHYHDHDIIRVHMFVMQSTHTHTQS